MNAEMHGRKIAHADLRCDCQGNPNCIVSNNHGCGQLELSATYHGDHDEFWVVEKNAGKEVARWNTRDLVRIVWAE